MTEAEKIMTVKTNMKLVRGRYEKVVTEYELYFGSRGQTAAWGGAGGRSGRVSRPTQARALAGIELEDEKRRMALWYGCIRRACLRLSDGKGRPRNRVRHDRAVARAIQMYVFERANAEAMRLAVDGVVPVSDRRVAALLREGVMAVLAEAEAIGLFEEERRESAGEEGLRGGNGECGSV